MISVKFLKPCKVSFVNESGRVFEERHYGQGVHETFSEQIAERLIDEKVAEVGEDPLVKLEGGV